MAQINKTTYKDTNGTYEHSDELFDELLDGVNANDKKLTVTTVKSTLPTSGSSRTLTTSATYSNSHIVSARFKNANGDWINVSHEKDAMTSWGIGVRLSGTTLTITNGLAALNGNEVEVVLWAI